MDLDLGFLMGLPRELDWNGDFSFMDILTTEELEFPDCPDSSCLSLWKRRNQRLLDHSFAPGHRAQRTGLESVFVPLPTLSPSPPLRC